MNHKSLYILFFTLVYTALQVSIMENPNAVFSIPYTTSFRSDKISASMGCGHNVAYSSYTYPSGIRDALSLYINSYSYGGTSIRCQFKTLFAKVLGSAQNYEELKSAQIVAGQIKRAIQSKIKNVIVEWKKQIQGDNLQNSQQFLNDLMKELESGGMNVYLKAPASYFCYDVGGKPYILGVQHVKNFIIEMYGEEIHQYKNSHQIMTGEEGESESNYPNKNCPKFPTYKQLILNNKEKSFFIEKSLQSEEAGYLGNEFTKILSQNEELYNQIVFFDAFPPNLIKI